MGPELSAADTSSAVLFIMHLSLVGPTFHIRYG